MDITKEPLFSRILCGFGVLLILIMAATWYLFLERKPWYLSLEQNPVGIIDVPEERAGLTIMINHDGPPRIPIEKIEKAQRSWRGKGGKGAQVHIRYPDGTYEEITFEELKSIVKPIKSLERDE